MCFCCMRVQRHNTLMDTVVYVAAFENRGQTASSVSTSLLIHPVSQSEQMDSQISLRVSGSAVFNIGRDDTCELIFKLRFMGTVSGYIYRHVCFRKAKCHQSVLHQGYGDINLGLDYKINLLPVRKG